MNFKVWFIVIILVSSVLTMNIVAPAGSWHTPCSNDDGVYEEFGPRPSELLISIYSDYGSELQAFKNKQIDFMDWALEPIDYQWFETNDPNHEQYSTAFYAEFGAFQYDLNCQVMPTMLASVRKAIAHIFDKQYFIDTYLNGMGHKADSALAHLPGWFSPSCTDKYNLAPRTSMTPLPDDLADWEAAYDLFLADLGSPVPDPENPSDFMFTWSSPFPTPDPTSTFPPVADGHLLVFARSEISVRAQQGSELKNYLEVVFPNILQALGKPRTRVHVDLYIVSRPVCRPQVMGYYRYHMHTGGWTLGKEPDFIMYYMTGMITKPDMYGQNYVMYANPSYDAEVDAMLVSTTPGSPTTPCDGVYHAWLAQEIMENDEPVIWIWNNAGYKACLSSWQGIVNQPNYGINSWWTFMNTHKVGSESCDTVRYGWAGDLQTLNIINATSYWDIDVLNKVYDTLIKVNPYDLTDDHPWIASGWEIGTWQMYPWSTATKITFHIREDVWWQDVPYMDRTVGDGHLDTSFTNMHLTPVDVAFSLEYLRDANPMPVWCPYISELNHVGLNLNEWGSLWPYNATLPPWWNVEPERNWQYNFVQHEDIGAYDITVYFNFFMPWLALHWVGERWLIPMHVWMRVPIGGSEDVDMWAEDLVYGCGPWVLADRTPGVSMRMIPFRNGQTYRGVTLERSHFALPVRPAQGTVGITGQKLIYTQRLTNFASVPLTIDYSWDYEILKWDGVSKWVLFQSGSSPTFAGFTIDAGKTIDVNYTYLLPYYSLHWSDWFAIHEAFHWTIVSSELFQNASNVKQEGADPAAGWYPTRLNYHPADIAGSSLLTFPYLGADGIVSIKDATICGVNWMQNPNPKDPLSEKSRADTSGDGHVGIKDVTPIGIYWLKTWTNNPPPWNPPAQQNLTIEVSGIGGTTSPTPGTHQYNKGSLASVRAFPTLGWVLDYWLLNDTNVGSANPYVVTMNANYNLTAVFREGVQYDLTIQVASGVGGTTSPAPGTYQNYESTGVSVQAIPDYGWIFSYWLRNGTNVGDANPYSITMNANYNLTAVFEVGVYYNLLVQASTGGTTTPAPGTYSYLKNTWVNVQAIPDSGKVLDRWLLNNSNVGAANPYSVHMTANYNLTAVFGTIAPLVHNGTYSAYISATGYNNWILQYIYPRLRLTVDDDLNLQAWVRPSKVGLTPAEYPSSTVLLQFRNETSNQPAFIVVYEWFRSSNLHNSTTVVSFFMSSWSVSAWNLLSRNVTADMYAYFGNIDFSDIVLELVKVYNHYSNESPGYFYIDDIKLSAYAQAIDNAIINGGFETGTFEEWEVYGTCTIISI